MRRSIVLTCLVALVTLAAACGGSAPTLSELQLTTTSITRGQQATGTVNVEDADGLGGLTINIRFTGAATVPQQTAPVAGATDSLTMAQIPFYFTLNQAAPAGAYTFYISATDGDENTSNELSAALQVN